ncbi:HAD family hydrolase [Thiohalorhabdus sp.]|uniref:HAD family hydrolase n=1 Tax=Thiohalorhabdus sp. TaxID=3094134 RepID=UPI002FC3BC20
MQQPAIRAVLLDFGGVIAEEGFRNGLAFLAEHHGKDPDQVLAQAMDAVYSSGYVTGTGSEADFWRRLGELSGLWVEPLEGENAILSRFRLRSEMLEWVHRLRRTGFLVGLLTDQTDWLGRLDQRDGFLAAFDRVYNSYRLGKGKRDPTLFHDVATDLNLPPERILLVDDSQANGDRARAGGFQVLTTDDPDRIQRALKALVREAGGTAK